MTVVAVATLGLGAAAPASAQQDEDATAPPQVDAGDPQRLTLSGRDAVVPVTLVNEGEQPAEVLVRFSSDKLDFPGGDEFVLALEPGLNSLDVEVSSRTTGDSSLVVRVFTADGTTELDRTRLTVRSTALSGVGIAIAIVALVVVLVWWLRHRRDLARDRRLVSRARGPGAVAPATARAGETSVAPSPPPEEHPS